MALEDLVPNAVEIKFDNPDAEVPKDAPKETPQDKPQAGEETPAPEATDTPSEPSEKEEAAAPKTFTEEEVKAQLEAEAAKIRNKYERKMKRELERVQTQPNSPAPKVEGKPTLDQFNDYEAFAEALSDWKAEQKIAERDQAAKEAAEQEKKRTEEERIADKRDDLIDKGESKYADFNEVIQKSSLQVSETAYLSILESDMSEDIIYHLAKNADEAEKFSKLTPYAQAKEIGRLEATLSAKAPAEVKTSKAPAPISPVSGSRAMTKQLEEMTVAEFEADARKRGARWIT